LFEELEQVEEYGADLDVAALWAAVEQVGPRADRGGHGGLAGARGRGLGALALLLLCCHPALSPASRIALTLRAIGDEVCGRAPKPCEVASGALNWGPCSGCSCPRSAGAGSPSDSFWQLPIRRPWLEVLFQC
jgi:hypothetical protein